MSLGGTQAIKVKDGMGWDGGWFISFASPFHTLSVLVQFLWKSLAGIMDPIALYICVLES